MTKNHRRILTLAAILGPIQSVAGWLIAGALWPGYDPIKKTISDLAADDSPVQFIQSSFFVVGATLTLVVAIYAKWLAKPGRVIIFAAGIATFGLTFFTTPSQSGHSDIHRIFAIISFVLYSAWPLFSTRMSPSVPWVLRPVATIGVTVLLTVVSVWFLLTWTDPNSSVVGLAERVIVVLQSWYMAFVIWVCLNHDSRSPAR
jgi:hypothetical membrane protein